MTIVQMNGHNYEVTLSEPPTVFVIVCRNPVSRSGNYVQDRVCRAIKPHGKTWSRAICLAKNNAA